jgi:hypothetical protein
VKLFIVFFDDSVSQNLDQFLGRAKLLGFQGNQVVIVCNSDLDQTHTAKIIAAKIPVKRINEVNTIESIVVEYKRRQTTINDVILYHPDKNEFEGELFNNYANFWQTFLADGPSVNSFPGLFGQPSVITRSMGSSGDNDDGEMLMHHVGQDNTLSFSRRSLLNNVLINPSYYCVIEENEDTIRILIENTYHRERHGEKTTCCVSQEYEQFAQSELNKYPQKFRTLLISHDSLHAENAKTRQELVAENQDYRKQSLAAYKLIAEQFFPKKTTGRDIAFGITGATLGAVAALQNYYFGGEFAKCFAQLIADKNNVDLTPENLEEIRLPFAVVSTLVNACINAKSVKAAKEYLYREIKILIAGGTSKDNIIRCLGFAVKVLGYLVTIVPNIQILYDAFHKVWGSEGTIVMELVGNTVNVALSIRGGTNLYNTATEFHGRIFGTDNRLAAQQIRQQLLNLTVEKNEFDAEKLSHGITASNNTTIHMAFFTTLIGTAALVYAVGAYFRSGVEGSDKTIELIDPAFNNEEVPASVLTVEYVISALITLFRYGAFLRAANLFAERIVDRYVAKPIVETEEYQNRHLNRMIAWDVFILLVGILGLTGGDGLVNRYLFNVNRDGNSHDCPKDNTLLTSSFSAVIAGIGVGPFNAKDFGDVCSGLKNTTEELLARCRGNMREFNRVTYGADHEQFRRNFINLLARTSDADVLGRYVASTQARNAQVNDESEPLLGISADISVGRTNYRFNGNINDLQEALKELACCGNFEYQLFLEENPLANVINLVQAVQQQAQANVAVSSSAQPGSFQTVAATV